ncbi:DNA primase family protein [Alkalicoccus chagannorensis]|uniref:DNA primase family protein n=1 Tax=Alkalicoccus chagannorensis TaxID=427072 RepID=UPI000426557F|nr:phage/plasmid primase, P4 family [Alkalicoccus chagannorensis]
MEVSNTVLGKEEGITMEHDGAVSFTVGSSRNSTKWQKVEESWSDFAERLYRTSRTGESVEEYHNMKKESQDNIKDVGGFVGATFSKERRKKDQVQQRQLITLDADSVKSLKELIWKADNLGYAYVLYTTHKHTPEKPRCRLVFPMTEPADPVKAEAISRKLAEMIGASNFDSSTHSPERLMYWPSTPWDGDFHASHTDAAWLDPEGFTSDYYDDWQDRSSWPLHEKEMESVGRKKADRAENPLEKPNPIGAFCQIYSVEEAIETYLSDVYEETKTGRYTFKEGSTTGGLVVYDDGLFAYSNHGTDPTSGRLCNSFDLVRIHRFGHLDEGAKPNTPVNKLPSYTAMKDLCKQDDAVKKKCDEALEEDFEMVIKESDTLTHLYNPLNLEVGTEHPRFPLTELGNGERIAYYNQKKLLYIHGKGWYVWDGKRWGSDRRGQVEKLTNETLRSITELALSAETKEEVDEIMKWAKKCEGRNVRTNSLQDAKPLLTITNEELDKNNLLLNVANGTLHLKNGKLLPHSEDNLLTQYADITFDQEATAPRWQSFLREVFVYEESKEPDEDLIHFVQKAIGYSLTGETKEQVMFFLTGEGSNGKSRFISAIQSILGDYAKQTNADTFISKKYESGINNDIARLDKARFVAAIESERGQELAESKVKQLTGGDKIAARFLREEYFEFLPEFKIWFLTNHKPIIKGTDEGIWRRIRRIPFNQNFSGKKKDPQLGEKLERELPGILNWAIEGYHMWLREGLEEPESVKEATDEYRNEMDLVKPFFDEYCHVALLARDEAKTLYEYYQYHCKINGDIVMGKRAFMQLLVSKGFKKFNGTDNKVMFEGLKIKEDIRRNYNPRLLGVERDFGG